MKKPVAFYRVTALFVSALLVFSNASISAASISSGQPALISEKLGRVEESFEGTSGKTIIFIQDAHASIQAQEHIAQMIGDLTAQENIKTVFEEGYEGLVPTDEYFGFIKDAKLKEKVSYFLMDQLRLGGAEYAHINRKKDFKLIGADSAKLHSENVRWYQQASARQTETRKDLDLLQKEITALIDTRFPKALRNWIKIKERFDAGNLPLFDYLKRTTADMPAPNKARYPGIMAMLNAEADAAAASKLSSIEIPALFREIALLETDFAAAHLVTEPDKKIFLYQQKIALLKRLNNIEVSALEYEAMKDAVRDFKTEDLARFIADTGKKPVVLSKLWESNIRDAARFYDLARERDGFIAAQIKKFSENPDEKTAVLVFGGFHQPGIKAILRQNHMGGIFVIPKMDAQDERHEAYYKRLMTVGQHSFEVSPVVKTASRPLSILRLPRSGADLEIQRISAAYRAMPTADPETMAIYLGGQPAGQNQKAAVAGFNPFRSEIRRIMSSTAALNPGFLFSLSRLILTFIAMVMSFLPFTAKADFALSPTPIVPTNPDQVLENHDGDGTATIDLRNLNFKVNANTTLNAEQMAQRFPHAVLIVRTYATKVNGAGRTVRFVDLQYVSINRQNLDAGKFDITHSTAGLARLNKLGPFADVRIFLSVDADASGFRFKGAGFNAIGSPKAAKGEVLLGDHFALGVPGIFQGQAAVITNIPAQQDVLTGTSKVTLDLDLDAAPNIADAEYLFLQVQATTAPVIVNGQIVHPAIPKGGLGRRVQPVYLPFSAKSFVTTVSPDGQIHKSMTVEVDLKAVAETIFPAKAISKVSTTHPLSFRFSPYVILAAGGHDRSLFTDRVIKPVGADKRHPDNTISIGGLTPEPVILDAQANKAVTDFRNGALVPGKFDPFGVIPSFTLPNEQTIAFSADFGLEKSDAFKFGGTYLFLKKGINQFFNAQVTPLIVGVSGVSTIHAFVTDDVVIGTNPDGTPRYRSVEFEVHNITAVTPYVVVTAADLLAANPDFHPDKVTGIGYFVTADDGEGVTPSVAIHGLFGDPILGFEAAPDVNRSELRDQIASPVSPVTLNPIAEMTKPAAVFVDVKELNSAAPAQVAQQINELLILLKMHSSFHVYLYNHDDGKVTVGNALFSALMKKFPAKFSLSGKLKHAANSEMIYVNLSFSQATEAREQLAAIQSNYDINAAASGFLSLNYEQAGALSAFLLAVQSATAEEIREGKMKQASRDQNGRWNVARSAIAWISSLLQTAFATAVSA